MNVAGEWRKGMGEPLPTITDWEQKVLTFSEKVVIKCSEKRKEAI